jgi:hypothetical protein
MIISRFAFVAGFLLLTVLLMAQEEESTTTFKFGGYIKADFLNSWYRNGMWVRPAP